MGWLKKLGRKLKKWKPFKTIAGVAKTIAGAVPLVGGLIKGGIGAAEKLLRKGRGVIAGIEDIAGRTGRALEEYERPPPGKTNWGLLALIGAGIWLLFSPNPGLLTAFFAGPVRTSVRSRRRKGKTTTKVTVSKAAPRKKSRKRKTTRRKRRR
jgi:hypothetical protein